MITQYKLTSRNKQTGDSPLQNEKQTHYWLKQEQTKQFIFKQEKCTVKKNKDYLRVILTIWLKGGQGQIFLKSQEKKKQVSISCNKLKRVLLDSLKIIITFNQKTKHFEKEESDELHIKFPLQLQKQAVICKKELSKFINKYNKQSYKQENKSFSTRKTQRETQCQSQQVTHKQKMLETSLRNSIKIKNQALDQKQAIQETNKLLKIQIQNLNRLLRQVENQLFIMRQQNEGLSKRLVQRDQKDIIIQDLNLKINLLEKQLKEKDIQKLKVNEMANKQVLQQSSKQITYLTNQISKLMKRIVQVELISKKAQKQLNLQKQEKNKMIKLRKDDQLKIDSLKAELEVQREQNKQKQVQLRLIEENYLSLKNKYKILQQNYNKLKQQSQLKEKKQKQAISFQKYSKLQRAYNQMKYLHIFEGPVLQNYLEYKQFLKETIEQYTRMKILKTVQIYKFDKKNTLNFHNYIDGHQNFVVIGKTVNGMFFAGFSESYVKPKQIANKGGLILSLTNFKAFELIKNMKSVTYDDYFMIFGNSEIRIKSQECKIFSNFGTSNGYYFAQGETVNILLGQGTLRQAMLENYEFHQVIFQDR